MYVFCIYNADLDLFNEGKNREQTRVKPIAWEDKSNHCRNSRPGLCLLPGRKSASDTLTVFFLVLMTMCTSFCIKPQSSVKKKHKEPRSQLFFILDLFFPQIKHCCVKPSNKKSIVCDKVCALCAEKFMLNACKALDMCLY